MNPEYLHQLEILNKNVSEMIGKSQELIMILKHTNGLDANTIVTALVGLFGVGIGAYISYHFSKKISNESSKARIAIQRKNLIYSKLYKELIDIKEQMSFLPKNGFYFQMITNGAQTNASRRWNDGRYFIKGKQDYTAPQFNTWRNIKSDVRITQVTSRVTVPMEELESAVINYFDSVNSFFAEFNTRENKNYHIDPTIFYFDDFEPEEVIQASVRYHTNQSPEWISNRKHEVQKLVDTVLKKPYLQASKTNFHIFKEKLDIAYTALETLIKEIVNKYEYGEEI